jgi:GNAT superfamily N-acetyltransferase
LLITLATFREPNEAYMLCGRLQAEGIFARVAHAYHVGNDWNYSTALGGVKVQVISEEMKHARAIELVCLSGEFKSLIEGEFGAPDQIKCPSCGSEVWKRRPFFLAAFSVLLSVVTGVVCPPAYWIYVCDKCGTEFRQRYGLIGKANAAALPDVTYEEVKLDDIPDLLAINGVSSSGGAEYEALLREGGKGWIGKIGGSTQAFVLAAPSIGLAALFVSQDYRRQGIGSKLHNYAVNWLFEQRTKLLGTTTKAERSADKFLNAWGWKLTDMEPDGSNRYELDQNRWRRKLSRPRTFVDLLRAWRRGET